MSVILKKRDFSLPAIVKVLAFSSAEEITPWNGMPRGPELLTVGDATLSEATDEVVPVAAEGGV